jgi:hypothetical protein
MCAVVSVWARCKHDLPTIVPDLSRWEALRARSPTKQINRTVLFLFEVRFVAAAGLVKQEKFQSDL